MIARIRRLGPATYAPAPNHRSFTRMEPLRNPLNLQARCKRIYGRAWRKGLWRDLGIPASTIGNYMDGRASIPAWLNRALEMIEARSRCTCGAHDCYNDQGPPVPEHCLIEAEEAFDLTDDLDDARA